MKDSGHILKEASLIKNLKHPHIPIIYDIYEDDISICIIEEYISGKSLRNYIYDEKSLKLNQICDIGVKLCNILEYLHNYQDGIIHLDIKPDNIIIDENNNVKLIDFGNALYGDESQQLSMLSPGYAAPEQYDNRQLTRSADIYSVGMILMFMVEAAVRKNDNSGHNVCQNTGDLSAIRHNKLYPIIRKCTRHKPQSRYKNITAVRRELERAAGWAALKANKQKQSDSYRHSYVIKISGTKRGIGVTHTALSMAYMLAEYGIKCILYEQSGNSDILEVMLNGKLYDNGLLYYKGVWFAADNVSYKMYGSDDTDNVNYKQNNDGNFDSMNFNVMVVDEGVYNAERVSYDDIICSFIQNDYDIIDIMVAGGKYGTANECSIIDSTVQHTRLMLNLLSEQQFYGYVNYIAGERICYRMPCVYGWSEHNDELVSVMKDFIEDNMPQIWECIITDTLKERCSVLYEKMCGIRKKVLKNFQRFIRGIGIGNEKWAYKEQQGKQD